MTKGVSESGSALTRRTSSGSTLVAAAAEVTGRKAVRNRTAGSLRISPPRERGTSRQHPRLKLGGGRAGPQWVISLNLAGNFPSVDARPSQHPIAQAD